MQYLWADLLVFLILQYFRYEHCDFTIRFANECLGPLQQGAEPRGRGGVGEGTPLKGGVRGSESLHASSTRPEARGLGGLDER